MAFSVRDPGSDSGLKAMQRNSEKALKELALAKQEQRPFNLSCAVPLALRPDWLPSSGPGLVKVPPECWAITVEQWMLFVETCRETMTWHALAANKWDKALQLYQDGRVICEDQESAVYAGMGELVINMYDVRDHFVVPWTRGTGNSIALLMNPKPQKAELMVSHAWAGSVIESRDAFLMASSDGIVGKRIPPETYMFFCTFCMYQPEDGAYGGMSISDQIAHKPFAKVIESHPAHGMRSLHTSIYELYDRLWTVHEVDEAIIAGVDVIGLFDTRRFLTKYTGCQWEWNKDKANQLRIDTSAAECRPEDKVILEAMILERGGYRRLDDVIEKFRSSMLRQATESFDAMDADKSGVFIHEEADMFMQQKVLKANNWGGRLDRELERIKTSRKAPPAAKASWRCGCPFQ